MNVEAIFHDECHDYSDTLEPNPGDEVRLRLRVARDEAVRVSLLTGESSYPMEKSETDDYFDYYTCVCKIREPLFCYSFLIENGEDKAYFSKIGLTFERAGHYEFKLIAGFKTPEWAKGAIMYQIFIDRFCRSDASPHPQDNEYIYIGKPVRYVQDWNSLPENFDVHRFYGGDLQGVWDKLEYLKSIGVEAIYFNPLFVSPSNHKYDAQDYHYIDPHLTVLKSDKEKSRIGGAINNEQAYSYIERTASKSNLEASNAFFAAFMKQAHSLGIRVILDGVFNHCGSFHKWMDREGIYEKARRLYRENYAEGAFLSAKSPYREYFQFKEDSKEYDGWWGHHTLPKLYYENSEKLVQEVLGIARKWLAPPYNVDGWRLDVAADLGYSEAFNHSFWERFREAVKSEKEDALILAEHYGSPAAWLDGRQWDTVMNYDGFMEPVTWFLTGLEKHSDRSDMSLLGNGEMFFNMLRHAAAMLPMPSLLTAMNELSNHDHSRFLTRTSKLVGRASVLGAEAAAEGINYAIFRQAITMHMSLPGAPTIYYGDEAGVCGFTDPDSRRTYPWGNENYEILMYYRYLALIHKHNICMKLGSLIRVMARKDLIAYARTYGKNKALVIIYTGKTSLKVSVPIYLAGIQKGEILSRMMYSDDNGHNAGKLDTVAEDSHLTVDLEPNASLLYIVEQT